jgi:hypothetical protein
VAVLLLVLLGALWHGQRLHKPFGIVDINGGGYCGLFLKHYEDFGLRELRGIGMTPRRVFEASQADPYLQHPPLLFWFMYLFGTDERAIRMPTVLLSIIAAVCLSCLLRPHLGAWPALAGGALLLGTPALAVYTQASIEPMMIGAGLLLWLATLRVQATTGGTRNAWRAVQAAVAFLGPWFDWGFALFCLGLVPLVATRSLAATARALALPAVMAAAAAASIIAWRQWALRAPLLAFDGEFPTMAELIRSTVLNRPPLLESLRAAGRWIPAAASLPVALAAIPGAVVLARRSARLALGLLLAGAAHFVLFADHALVHVHFHCLLCGLLAASVAALATVRLPVLRAAPAVVVALLVGAAWWTTLRTERHNDTTFFRDLGAALVDATRVAGPDGTKGPPARLVTTNFHYPFAYYDATPYIIAPPCLTSLRALEIAQRDRNQPHGVAYLWFKRMEGPSAHAPRCAVPPELAAYLEAQPKQRVPDLEVELLEPGIGFDLRVREVWLVTLPHIE